MLRAMFCAAPVCWRALPEMFCTRLAIWLETCSISSSAAPAFSASSAPPTTSVVLRSIDTTASLVSVWMVRTSTSICLVALAARSARRCTSSATTAKPRPASPAIEAWIEAFSARMLVCSAMSLISSTMLPISCELSPEALDALGGLLDGLADGVHAVDRAAHRIAALVRDLDRVARHVGGALGVAGHLLDRGRHAAGGLGGRADLLGLRAARLGQVLRRAPGSAGWPPSSWIAEPLMVVTRPRSASTA